LPVKIIINRQFSQITTKKLWEESISIQVALNASKVLKNPGTKKEVENEPANLLARQALSIEYL